MIQESTQHLLDRVKNKASHTNHFSPSIFMVPSVLRDLSPNSFNPRLVSIGPLHRKDDNVQAFEEQKLSYLIDLMSHINSPQEEILQSCMEKAYASMEKIKACYVSTKPYTDAKIAEMMVVDSCFILEFMLEVDTSLGDKSYSGKVLHSRTLMHDLVLLENQIPLFFLEEIFHCTISKFRSRFSFIQLIYPILSAHNLFKGDLNIDNVSIGTTDHMLSLLHQCFKPPENIRERFINTSPDAEDLVSLEMSYSAIDLERAGVNFKPSKDPTWIMGMEIKQLSFPYSFWSWSKPTLTMSVLKVHDSTELLLRNLIAYEESSQTPSYVTSYAIAMDVLINTQEDVAKLIKSGVLFNGMGSNKEAANMINSICKNVTSGSFYEEEWEKLNKYCNGYWPKHIARMRRTYFNSPWSIIALLVGIIIFVLQVVQTIFTIKSSRNK